MKKIIINAFAVIALCACSTTKSTPANTSTPPANEGEIKAQIPASFSPNGDGQNDELCFTNVFAQLPGASISIYSRWGIEIWKTGDASNCWDGKDTKTKAAMPAGTYIYNIHPKTGSPIVGQVTLVR